MYSHPTRLVNEDGLYLGEDPNTDLVVVFAVNLLKLTEKSSVSGLFAVIVTAGFNDIDVAPEVWNSITIFKRDTQDRRLKRVWKGQCFASVLSMPVSGKFSEVIADIDKAGELFAAAARVTIKKCTQTMANLAAG